MKTFLLLGICLVVGIQYCSAAGKLGIGIGFGRSSKPYNNALQTIQKMGIYALKTWSINPEWLDAVQIIFQGASFSKFFFEKGQPCPSICAIFIFPNLAWSP